MVLDVPENHYFFICEKRKINGYGVDHRQRHMQTRNVTVCNKCPRMSLIMTLIPGCDLEHSQETLTLGVGT